MKHIEMDVWKFSIDLAVDIYRITDNFPSEEKFGLTSQMRRCAVSVSSNIAEGAGRRTHNDYRSFLYIASGSLSELETQVIIAHSIKILSKECQIELLEKINRVRAMLLGVIKFLS